MSLSNDRLQRLMRDAAIQARQAEHMYAAIDAAVVDAIGLADDPVLAARVRRGNRLNLEQWLSRTITEPGRLPTYEPTPEILRAARDNARTGWSEVALEAFRAGESAAWAGWMQIVFDMTDDAEEIRGVLDFSYRSITGFVEEAARTIREENARGLAELAEGSPSRRRHLVERLLSGGPVNAIQAGRHLGYRLDQTHQALILWSLEQDMEPARLDLVVEEIGRHVPAARVLSIVEDRLRRWVWLTEPINAATADTLCPEAARIAIGPPQRGLDGFRRSHDGAKIAQRILAGAAGVHRVARYEDVRLIARIARDDEEATVFLTETLGALQKAPAHLRQTLRIYLREGENISHTAKALELHRNTVMRHLASAEDRLPRPLAEARTEIAAALDVQWWRAGD